MVAISPERAHVLDALRAALAGERSADAQRAAARRQQDLCFRQLDELGVPRHLVAHVVLQEAGRSVGPAMLQAACAAIRKRVSRFKRRDGQSRVSGRDD